MDIRDSPSTIGKFMKKIDSNRSKAVATAAGLTSLPLSSDDISTVGLAGEKHSSLNPVTGALAASVPMESGVWQIKSSGTKCHKENMTMSKKAKFNRKRRQQSVISTQRPTSDVSTLTGAACGRGLQMSSSDGDSALSVLERIEFEYSVVMNILCDMQNQYCYRPFGNSDATEIEIECSDDIQRLQFRVAACRHLKHEIDQRNLASTTVKSLVSFSSHRSSVDNSFIGVKVIFELSQPLPEGIEADEILTNLGVPSAPVLMHHAKADVYQLIEERFAGDGPKRSEYEVMFPSSGMHSIYADMCASTHRVFGDITFPPMTLNEFGNFICSLHYFGSETALATLRRIYSDRCLA
jgi:hypothetical protein